jgi:hypothetical protein
MDILYDALIFILKYYPYFAITGAFSAGLYFKIHKKRSNGGAYQFATVILIFFGIVYLSIPLVMKYELPQYLLNEFTIMSLILAFIALAFNNLKELYADQPFISLNSEIKAIQDEINTKGDHNTQQIITQINHLEESQKALADQIQSLKNGFSSYKPTETHEDDDPADRPADKDNY